MSAIRLGAMNTTATLRWARTFRRSRFDVHAVDVVSAFMRMRHAGAEEADRRSDLLRPARRCGGMLRSTISTQCPGGRSRCRSPAMAFCTQRGQSMEPSRGSSADNAICVAATPERMHR